MTLTKKGKGTLYLISALFLSSLATGFFPLYILFGFFFSLFLLSYLFPTDIGDLSIRRIISNSVAIQDEVVDVILNLHNSGKTKLFFEVWDEIPETLKKVGGQEYALLRFQYGSTQKLAYRIACHSRGIYSIGPVVVRCQDPFGFFENRVEFPEFSELIILPKTHYIVNFPFISPASLIRLGNYRQLIKGGEGEFHGVREYEPQDQTKHIHWKLTAKTGKLMVKLFEHTVFMDCIIFLDGEYSMNIGKGRETTFEYGIQTATSLSQYALNMGGRVGLVMDCGERLRIPVGSGSNQFYCITHTLSTVEAEGKIPIAMLINQERHRIPDRATVIIITPSTDKHLISEIDLLKSKNHQVIFIHLDIVSFFHYFANLEFFISDSEDGDNNIKLTEYENILDSSNLLLSSLQKNDVPIFRIMVNDDIGTVLNRMVMKTNVREY